MGIVEFKYRLQTVIDKEPSVNAFAKKCECTEGVLRSYLRGDSLPGLDKLVRIAKAANVSIEWLALGSVVSEPQPEYARFGSDREMEEIVELLQKDLPELKGKVLKLLQAKKSLKDAFKEMGLNGEDWF